MSHDDQVEQAHQLVRDLLQVALARLSKLWMNQGLSLPQLRLLLALAHHGPATIGQIADYLHIGQSAASLLVERLVQAQLIERSDDPNDRRRAIVRLTSEGEALMGRRREGQQRLYAWLNGLDDTRLSMLTEMLTAVLALGEDSAWFEDDSL